MNYAFVFSGALIGFSWFFPLSLIGAILNIAGFLVLCGASQHAGHERQKLPYGIILFSGIFAHLFGFYWIFGTIKEFGEFPPFAALAVFLFFIAASSLQFPIFLLLRSYLPNWLDRFALRTPLAWVAVELLCIRIFPWSASHPLASIPALVQLAEIGGATLTTFVFLLVCELTLQSLRGGSWRRGTVSGFIVFAVIIWGSLRIKEIEALNTRQIPVALVQGAIPLKQKHDKEMAQHNLLEYQTLSKPFDVPGTLIIWPETVLMDWISESVGDVKNDPRLPALENGASLIFGSLSYRTKKDLFNSAFAVGPNGEVPLPYHKRILMPFGEFTPFGDLFPTLRTLNNIGGDFSEGTGDPLLTVPLKDQQSIQVTPLICYEDVLPRIAVEGARSGAELLVNLTNDAWFGESIAPFQHHQIALFRAIETRRTLVRATNTGLSAVVAPTGKTTLHIEPFKKGTISGNISLYNEKTLFTQLPVQSLWTILALLSSCLSIFRFVTISKVGR